MNNKQKENIRAGVRIGIRVWIVVGTLTFLPVFDPIDIAEGRFPDGVAILIAAWNWGVWFGLIYGFVPGFIIGWLWAVFKKPK